MKTTAKLDLEYAQALRFMMVMPRNEVSLVLVGCGGTGSWLAPAVVRIARLLHESRGTEVHVTFVDPDSVEEKNIYRQNFCAAEIGKNKAQALAERYGFAWGVEVRYAACRYSEHLVGGGGSTIVIGCVDTTRARLEISGTSNGWPLYWLDCGNEKNSGQVVLGAMRLDSEKAFSLDGFCGWLPRVEQVHPELVKSGESRVESREPSSSETSEQATSDQAISEMSEADLEFVDSVPLPNSDDIKRLMQGKPARCEAEAHISCAEMALRSSQGLSINQRMAAEAADYLVRMLVTKDLRKFATYIDLESGSCRSTYITKKEIEKWMK